jgi:MFS family permease
VTTETSRPQPLASPEPSNARPSGAVLRRSMVYATVAWMFGAVWLATVSGTPITLFAERLGCTEFEFGVLAAAPFFTSLLSLPASLVIERTGVRKGMFLVALYAQRLMWVPIALVPVWILDAQGPAGAGWAVAAFLALMFAMHSGQAVGGVAWVSWMADVVPGRLRGRYFSRRRQLGMLTALPAALVVGWVLDKYAGADRSDMQVLRVCGWAFIVAGLIGVVDIVLFQFVPNIPRPGKSGAHLFQSMAGPLKNREFLWFAGFVAVLTFAVSFMGQFVTLYVIREAHVTAKGTQLMLIVGPFAAQLLMLPLWGKAIDRMGRRPVLKVATLGFAPVAIGWSFMGPDNIWLGYVLSATGAALWTGVDLANGNFVMDMAGTDDAGAADAKDRGSSYVAVNMVIVNVAGCLGGLASGAIAETFKDSAWHVFSWMRAVNYYDVLFVLSGVLRLLAVVIFIPHIHEPTAKRGRETLRFMTTNVYSNLQNAILAPYEFFRRVRSRDADGS